MEPITFYSYAEYVLKHEDKREKVLMAKVLLETQLRDHGITLRDLMNLNIDSLYITLCYIQSQNGIPNETPDQRTC